MASVFMPRRRGLTATAGIATMALALAACGSSGGSSEGASLTIGTTDKITTIDPAGSYDNGSFAVMNQVFPFLLNTPFGSPDPEPDIAKSAEFTAPNEYTVILKDGLKFANGHDLTASDVKFTFDRQLAILANGADGGNGPASLLYNLESTEAVDDTTVVFHLKSANDQIFPQILSSPAGPIVDEEVFAADALTPDQDIVDGNAFAGPYVITSYDLNNLVSYEANPDYEGLLGAPKTGLINVKYFAEASNLKLEIQDGTIDVAYRSLSATDIEDLRVDDCVKAVDGPGGEIRYIVFNFATQPYAATTADAGVATPVELSLQYSNDHYGPSSGDEYALIKDQLESSGLFTVDLQTTEWVQYAQDRTADVYPAYQLGWFPDYSDADNYLTPFFLVENFLGNHYANQDVNDMILQQAVTTDPDERAGLIEDIQAAVAQDLSTVPYLQGAQVAVVGPDVNGAEDTLDASFKFRYGALSKG